MTSRLLLFCIYGFVLFQSVSASTDKPVQQVPLEKPLPLKQNRQLLFLTDNDFENLSREAPDSALTCVPPFQIFEDMYIIFPTEKYSEFSLVSLLLLVSVKDKQLEFKLISARGLALILRYLWPLLAALSLHLKPKQFPILNGQKFTDDFCILFALVGLVVNFFPALGIDIFWSSLNYKYYNCGEEVVMWVRDGLKNDPVGKFFDQIERMKTIKEYLPMLILQYYLDSIKRTDPAFFDKCKDKADAIFKKIEKDVFPA